MDLHENVGLSHLQLHEWIHEQHCIINGIPEQIVRNQYHEQRDKHIHIL